jgi:capsular polysaccharide transport system permease protein
MLKFFKENIFWSVFFLLAIVIAIYWFFIASDRYVSTANVVLESPQVNAQTELNFQAILTGGGSASDMLIMRDYLLSVDMLNKVELNIGFRQHYSQKDYDYISRLKEVNAPLEILHKYYRSVIDIELDEYSKILRISVTAYDPAYAKKLLAYLLEEGEAQMNEMGKRLASEQVNFLEAQVENLAYKLSQSRKEILDFENKNGIASPENTLETIGSVIYALESELAILKADKIAYGKYQSENSSQMQKINSKIGALEEQIKLEKRKMAVTGGEALNVLTAEYQALEMKLEFSKESYSSALAALESTRIESIRKLKQLSILQSPTLPEYSNKPDRLYNVIVSWLFIFILFVITHLVYVIIRDHKE